MREDINMEKPVQVIRVKGFDEDTPDGVTEIGPSEHPILSAARFGDKRELKRLLEEKKDDAISKENPVYPRDWKYTFEDLIVTDNDGRTALHLAACFGNHTTSLSCAKLILESDQLVYVESETEESQMKDLIEQNRKLLECKDKNRETALHLAIENRAVATVSLLLENQASVLSKNKDGVEAVELIYKYVPDAMKGLYNGCITLLEKDDQYDHTIFTVNWGPVIGFPRKVKTRRNVLPKPGESPGNQTSLLMEPEIRFLKNKETECLHYILNADRWGATLLRHPLIKWYLYLKWKRISWFFWITFMLQILWLSSYALIFVVLQLDISELESVNCTEKGEGVPAIPDASKNETICGKTTEELEINWLWHFMMILTMFETVKEVYQMWVLKKSYTTSLENQLQILFIVLFVSQYIILVTRLVVNADVIASLSAMTIIISAILMILQLGKTPRFGLQVAAFKKVFKSCGPHLPIFVIWFIGFGLAFWALFYNAEKSWTLGMVAIIAAMGTGELNAKENLEHFATGSFSLPELVHVFSILLFVVVIVTLYFNLLVGYAVTDLQVLLPKAETLQLSNKLSTIYTIETFLVSRLGRVVVASKYRICSVVKSCFGGKMENVEKAKDPVNPIESIYVLPPSQFHSCGGLQKFKFTELPDDQLEALRELAFTNLTKAKEKNRPTEGD